MTPQPLKDPPTTLGARCRAARVAAGISQDEAAFRLRGHLPKGRSPGGSVISRIEADKIAHPEPYVIAAMAEVYGCDLDDIAPEMAEEASMLARVLAKATREGGLRSACAPWDSNPEPADYVSGEVDGASNQAA